MLTGTAPSYLVLIPSFNTGPILVETVRAARGVFAPVWVVLDGSTDGSAQALAALPPDGLRVLALPRNVGKGAAVLHGLREAAAAGFTHALTMDADGQHPASTIRPFIAASQAAAEAMILGVPQFGPEAPALRVRGRRITNWLVRLETLGGDVGDALFGLRVYPIAPLLATMATTRWMRRFDFDPEAAVRLCWAGVAPVNLAAPVRYLSPAEGGVSHFRYGRDNLLLTWMHIRLLFGSVRRLPGLAWRRAGR